MKKITKLLSMFLIGTILASISISAQAIELLSGRRWANMATSGNVPYCNIKLYAGSLTGGWETDLTRAINNWNNYSSGKVKITKVASSQANCELITYNGSWPYVDAAAFTMLTDQNGNTYDGGVTGRGVSAQAFGSRIKFAGAIFNPKYGKGYDGLVSWGQDITKNRAKTIVHEIGHMLNLAHRGKTENSVMRTGWKYSGNYDRPTSVDVTDLKNMYNQIYS